MGRMVLMHSNKREEIKEAQCGDIIAIVGLKDTTTGDTLCAVDAPVVLEKMDFPEPVIKVSCEPTSQKDADKLGEALNKLAAEDPSFRYSRDEESNQTVIEGMGELHLEIIIDRLKREFKVEAEVGKPQVAYRETITEPVELWYTHKKQTGGSGQYAKLCMVYEPNPGEGFEFQNSVVGGAVPKEYVPAVVKGTEGELLNGIRMGFPVVDVKCSLKAHWPIALFSSFFPLRMRCGEWGLGSDLFLACLLQMFAVLLVCRAHCCPSMMWKRA